MKILLIHQDLFYRGGQYVTAALARGLTELGHEVKVAVSCLHRVIQEDRPDAEPFSVGDKAKVHVMPSRKARHNIFALARIIIKEKPDVLVPCTPQYLISAVLARLLTFSRAKIVYIEHCPVSEKPGCGFGWLFERWIYRSSDKIVTVSEGLKRCISSRYRINPDKIDVIHNPVYGVIPRFSGKSKGEKCRVVSAGGLVKNKGFDTVIKAFGIFHKQVTNSELLIYGVGPYEQELKNIVSEICLEDTVVFCGYSKNLAGNFSRANIFAYGSEYETFGNVIVEALVAGAKVVCCDCPVGPREILRHGALGQLVPIGDYESMAKSMLKAFNGEWQSTEDFDAKEYLESTAIERYNRLLLDVVNAKMV